MKQRPFIAGIIATDALLVLFIVLVTSISGWAKTKDQFAHYWVYLVLLAIGFGVQVGMFVYLREIAKRASKKIMAVTGGTSTASMISCCVHYLANILPLISASGVAVFVEQYQAQFFWVGLLFNAFGIIVIARRIVKAQQHMGAEMDCGTPQPFLNNTIVITVFLVVVGLVFLLTGKQDKAQTQKGADPKQAASQTVSVGTTSAKTESQTKTNTEGGMTVDVTPRRNADGSLDFDVAINNHVQGVTQDMVAVSSLTDTSGRVVRPTAWEGDPPGGHHRSGTLKFDVLAAPPKSLTIRDLGGVPERTFEWENLTS